MDPTLTLFGRDLPSYELLLALGACVLVGVAAGGAPRDVPRERLFAWISGTYLAAVCGARIAFALSRLPDSREALVALARVDAVGFSSIGAVVTGALAAWWLARALALPFEGLIGPLVLGGCLFGVLARMGCFLAGCCHGRPSTLPWAVVYPTPSPATMFHGDAVAVHPSPLYEAALLLAIAAWVARSRADRPSGAVRAALAYLAGRFVLDFFRGDALRLEGLTPMQWLAFGVLAAGIVVAAGRTLIAAWNPSPAGGVSLK
jgi:phosphatidylglycerol:prolipoprotein diacylglycerol transferase